MARINEMVRSAWSVNRTPETNTPLQGGHLPTVDVMTSLHIFFSIAKFIFLKTNKLSFAYGSSPCSLTPGFHQKGINMEWSGAV